MDDKPLVKREREIGIAEARRQLPTLVREAADGLATYITYRGGRRMAVIRPVTTGWPDAAMLEAAWGIIANAGGGNWDNETLEWRQAAERWREAYHRQLPALSEP